MREGARLTREGARLTCEVAHLMPCEVARLTREGARLMREGARLTCVGARLTLCEVPRLSSGCGVRLTPDVLGFRTLDLLASGAAKAGSWAEPRQITPARKEVTGARSDPG